MKWFKTDFKSAKMGATLSEMCVVIAIIAIVAVSVVTFTSLSSEVTKAGLTVLSSITLPI